MTTIKYLLFALLICLGYTSIAQDLSQPSSAEDFSEYYDRINNKPKDSPDSSAKTSVMPKWAIDLDFLDGYKIPTFSAKDLHGKEQHITYKDKLTLLNFWFIACHPCVEEIPYLNILQDKYQDYLDVVSIGRDEEIYINEFILKHPINYIIIPDAQDLIDNIFQMKWGYPMSILVDSNGIVLAMTRGFLGTDDINYQKIEQLILENIRD